MSFTDNVIHFQFEFCLFDRENVNKMGVEQFHKDETYICHPLNNSISQSLNKHLPSTHYVLGTLPEAINRTVGKMDKNSRLPTMEYYVTWMIFFYSALSVFTDPSKPFQSTPTHFCHLHHYHQKTNMCRHIWPSRHIRLLTVSEPNLAFSCFCALIMASSLCRRAFNLQILPIIQNCS